MSDSVSESDGIEEKTGKLDNAPKLPLGEGDKGPSPNGGAIGGETGQQSVKPQILVQAQQTRKRLMPGDHAVLSHSVKSFGDEQRDRTKTGIRQMSEQELLEKVRDFPCGDDCTQVLGDLEKALDKRIVLLEGKDEYTILEVAYLLALELLHRARIERIERVDVAKNRASDPANLLEECPRSFIIVTDALADARTFIFRRIRCAPGQILGSTGEQNKIWRILKEYFGTEDLKDLCFGFETRVDYEHLPGEGKDAKARELVSDIYNRLEITSLIRAIRKERPHLIDDVGDPAEIISTLQQQLEECSSYLILTITDACMEGDLQRSVRQMLGLFSEQGVRRVRYDPPGSDTVSTSCSEHRNSVASFDDEIRDFFESLDDEKKILALNLSLLEGCLETDFWQTHDLLIPKPQNAGTKADGKDGQENKRGRRKKTGDKRIPQFGVPKNKLLEDVRAHAVAFHSRIGGTEYVFQCIEFVDERYAQAIRDYVKRNHPGFVQRMIAHLVEQATKAQVVSVCSRRFESSDRDGYSASSAVQTGPMCTTSSSIGQIAMCRICKNWLVTF